MRRLIIGAATASVLVASGLAGAAPSLAAGPGLPPDMVSLQLGTSDFSGEAALPTSKLSFGMRWTLCNAATGRCNGSIPTAYELQVGVASACQATTCTWTRAPALVPGTIDPGLAGAAYWQDRTPALDQLLGPGLAPGTVIGVTARVRNADGWSGRIAARVSISSPVANDHVPTNISPPTVVSYTNSVQPSLVVGGHVMASQSVWRGAASRPMRTRNQVVACRDAACNVAEADWAQAAAQGWQCDVPQVGQGDPLTDGGCHMGGALIKDSDIGFRARAQAQNLAGWSAWAVGPVVLLHPAAPPLPICILCRPIGIPIDLGAFVPVQPVGGAAAIAQPSPTRAPAFTKAADVAAIAVQSAVPADTALGAMGTTWVLPASWSAPDLVQNTAFTLWGCATADGGSCHTVGSWPADANVAGTPRLTTMGAVAPGTPYVRVAQTTDLVNPNGVQTSFTTLSDWISVTSAAAPVPVNDPNANGVANGAQPDGQAPAADPAIASVLPEVTAAGVNQSVSPVAGTTGTGTVAGRTMVVHFPVSVLHNVKYRATARITPAARGTVRFVLTRRTPSNKVVVGKVRVAKVRKGKAVTSWRFESSKPNAKYVIVATFTPKRASVQGITVTLTTTLK